MPALCASVGLASRSDLPPSQQPLCRTEIFLRESHGSLGLERLLKQLIWGLGRHGGGEGQTQSRGLDISLGLPKKPECQEVAFPGVLEDYS